MRTLSQIYPEFSESVSLIVVGFGPSQTISTLREYQAENDSLAVFAEGPNTVLESFSVTTRSTKIGLNRDGVVVFREGYGMADADTWRSRLRSIASSS